MQSKYYFIYAIDPLQILLLNSVVFTIWIFKETSLKFCIWLRLQPYYSLITLNQLIWVDGKCFLNCSFSTFLLYFFIQCRIYRRVFIYWRDILIYSKRLFKAWHTYKKYISKLVYYINIELCCMVWSGMYQLCARWARIRY